MRITQGPGHLRVYNSKGATPGLETLARPEASRGRRLAEGGLGLRGGPGPGCQIGCREGTKVA